jgi:hypothetical protein
MDREEMLKQMGVTNEEFKDFLRKYHHFVKTLDAAQLDLLNRSLPTMREAITAFGPDVDPVELIKLFGDDGEHPTTALMFPLGSQRTFDPGVE